jgi:hypothetical protein
MISAKQVTCAVSGLPIYISNSLFLRTSRTAQNACVHASRNSIVRTGNNDDYDADGGHKMRCTRRPGQMAWSAPLKYVLLRSGRPTQGSARLLHTLPYASSRHVLHPTTRRLHLCPRFAHLGTNLCAKERPIYRSSVAHLARTRHIKCTPRSRQKSKEQGG